MSLRSHFLMRFYATRGFSAILCSEIFVYSEAKILEKCHFMDLSNEYKFPKCPKMSLQWKKRFFYEPWVLIFFSRKTCGDNELSSKFYSSNIDNTHLKCPSVSDAVRQRGLSACLWTSSVITDAVIREFDLLFVNDNWINTLCLFASVSSISYD